MNVWRYFRWLIVVGLLLIGFPSILPGQAASGEIPAAPVTPLAVRLLPLRLDAPTDTELVPLSLAAGDLNNDGMLDLLVGYAQPGGGRLGVYWGSAEVRYPTDYTAQLRQARGEYPQLPFAPGPEFILPAPPDWLAAGDFNADGAVDVAFASRDQAAMYYLWGNNRGELKQAERVELPANVTAMISGELNLRDGLPDLALALSGPQGAELWLLESPRGAARAEPERFPLPSAAQALLLADLNGDALLDAAAGAGQELVVVYGRERKLSLPQAQRLAVPPPRVTRQTFAGHILSLAVDNFISSPDTPASASQPELAVLLESGRLELFSLPELEALQSSYQPGAEQLLSTRLGDGQESLLLAIGAQSTSLALAPSAPLPPTVSTLALHLNGDAFSDLIMLEAGSGELSLLLSAPQAVFTVNDTGDEHDAYLGDNTCDISGNPTTNPPSPYIGICTLHAALDSASATDGADTILFNLTRSIYIQPLTSGFNISEVTVQASLGEVVIDGSLLPADYIYPCLDVGSNATLSGLVVQNCKRGGVEVYSDNFITGNYIGLNAQGSAAAANYEGIEIQGSRNVIGGSVPAARNVISGNTNDGIKVSTYSAAGNRIEGNYIGTDPNGALDIPNDTGVSIAMSHGVTLGGTSGVTPGASCSGACNLISGNAWTGIEIWGSDSPNLYAKDILVQGNFIGTTPGGLYTFSGQHSHGGIAISSSSAFSNTIGGSTPAARNLISGNDIGIRFSTYAHDNRIQGNFIGTDTTGRSALGNQDSHGIFFNTGRNNLIGGIIVRGGDCLPPCNLLSGNASGGIEVDKAEKTNIIGNYIGVDVTGLSALPNYAGVLLYGAITTTLGAEEGGAANIISGNLHQGVLLMSNDTRGALIRGNLIGLDGSGEGALGNQEDGITVYGSNHIIGGSYPGEGNQIAFNGGDGVDVSGSLSSWIGLRTRISSNKIFGNTGLGINLGASGVALNDPQDADDGPNHLQNFPRIMQVAPTLQGIRLNGVMSSTANTSFRLEFFNNGVCDGSGYGEGAEYLGYINVQTGLDGTAPFSTTFSTSPGFFTATATDPEGNTSEFSHCANAQARMYLESTPVLEVSPGGKIHYTLHVLWDSIDGTPALNAKVYAWKPLYTRLDMESVTANYGDYTVRQDDFTWQGDLPDEQELIIGYDVVVDDCPALFAQFPGAWPGLLTAKARLNIGADEYWAQKSLGLRQPDLVVVGLEVTQAVQNLNNIVPLVAGRKAYARVFIRSIPPQGVTICDVPNVTAQLTVGSIGTIDAQNSITAQTLPEQARPTLQERSDRNQSLNFEISGAWLSEGEIPFTAEVNPGGFRPDAQLANNTRLRNLTIKEQEPLNLALYQVQWQEVPFGKMYYGSVEDGLRLARAIAKFYPFAEVTVYLSGLEVFAPTFGTQEWGWSWTRMATIMSRALKNDKSHQRVPADAIGYGYLGAATREDAPDGGEASLFGWAAAGGTHISQGVYVAVHEVGHIYDLKHVDGKPEINDNCKEPKQWIGWPYINIAYSHPQGRISSSMLPSGQSTYYGFNTFSDTPTSVRPETWDIMTYCPNRWVSDYTWNHFFDAHPIQATAATLSAPQLYAPEGEYIQVSGILTPTAGAAALDAFYRLTLPAQPLPEPGPYEVRFYQDGTLLASYPFTTTVFAESAVEDEHPAAPLLEFLPYPAGTTSIQVYYQTTLLAERLVSTHSPTVTWMTPAYSQTLPLTATLSWQASDEDGDDLLYTVQLSRDDGQTWQMVALDVSTTTINLDTSLLGASQLARLRLLASDGVNTAEAISPRFILAPRSPVVVIFSPEDGSTFAPGQSIELSGSAWDPEDGLLPGAELAWFVDGNALGTGENMTLPPLTAGVHTITLQAQDSDGNLITRQVTVNLAYRLFLTAMFR